MKSIEERAYEYTRSAQKCQKCGEEDYCLRANFRCNHFRRVYYAFINGVKEQKEIDIEAFDDWLCRNSWITRDEGNRKPLEELRNIIQNI